MKVQTLESFRELSNHEIPQRCTLVTYGLCILGVLMGSQNFAMHFLDEVSS